MKKKTTIYIFYNKELSFQGINFIEVFEKKKKILFKNIFQINQFFSIFSFFDCYFFNI